MTARLEAYVHNVQNLTFGGETFPGSCRRACCACLSVRTQKSTPCSVCCVFCGSGCTWGPDMQPRLLWSPPEPLPHRQTTRTTPERTSENVVTDNFDMDDWTVSSTLLCRSLTQTVSTVTRHECYKSLEAATECDPGSGRVSGLSGIHHGAQPQHQRRVRVCMGMFWSKRPLAQTFIYTQAKCAHMSAC